MSKKNKKEVKKNKKANLKKTGNVKLSFWKNSALLIPIAVILLLTAIIFSPSINNDFVNWDDDVNVLENENLNGFNMTSIKKIFHYKDGIVIGNYNPLPIFTFLIDKELLGGYDKKTGQYNAKPFHIHNLVLHLICIFLVYRIFLLLKLSPTAAIIGTLLFAIHPMRVESVAWVTERKDVLLGVFYFAAIISYIKYLKATTDKKQFYYILTLVLFILSLFSKIQAVALPLSMLAIDYYFNRKMEMARIIEKIPHFALSLAFGIAGILFLKDQGSLAITDDVTDYSILQRLVIGTFSYCVYLIKLIIPYELSPMYPYPSKLNWYYYLTPPAVLGVVALFFYWYKQKKTALVFGLAFFTFNVMFLLQVVGAGQALKADRFTYIPYLGLFFIIAYGYDYFVKQRPNSKTFLTAGLGIYLLVLSGLTFQQCKIWKDGETMWSHVLKSYERSSLAWGNRARWKREQQGDIEGAIADYKQAIAMTSRKPDATYYNSLGKTYFDSNRPKEALENYNTAITIKNDNPEFYANRGAAYGSMNQLDLALSDLSKAIELDNDHDNSYLNRSLVYSATGQHDLAIKDHENYLRLKPNSPDIWYEKGMAQMRVGLYQESLLSLTKAIGFNPNPNLGLFYRERARLQVFYLNNKAAAQQDLQAAQSRGAQIDADLLQALQ